LSKEVFRKGKAASLSPKHKTQKKTIKRFNLRNNIKAYTVSHAGTEASQFHNCMFFLYQLWQ